MPDMNSKWTGEAGAESTPSRGADSPSSAPISASTASVPIGGGTLVRDPEQHPSYPPTKTQSLVGAPIAAPDPIVGTILLERYRILSKIGEGGMGSVYLAEHATIRKKLAVKILSPEYAHKPDLVERFLQEARAASMIDQENVVEITDFGHTPGGSVFFVMEFLQGEDLSKTIKRIGPIPWNRAKPIALQICRALQKAHDAGIIHRDMKPENCFRITRGHNEDFIKVLDFGIAKVTGGEDGEGAKGLTRTGMIFGTPEYMSPEQAQGLAPDHRVDVYACGVILYEMMTGRVPFIADTFMAVLTKHMFEAPPAPSSVAPDAQIPAEVEAIILKALQKEPSLRFQSMQEMEGAIEAVGTGAAAVSVVHEDLHAPASGGAMTFAGLPAVGDGSTLAPTGRGDTLEPGNSAKDGRGLKIAVAALAFLFAGTGVLYATGAFPVQAEEKPELGASLAQDSVADAIPGPGDLVPAKVEPIDPPLDTEPSMDAAPSEPDVPPEPEVVFVQVKLQTPGVDAIVLRAADGKVLGHTNSTEPLQIEQSDSPMAVRLEAAGYKALDADLDVRESGSFRYRLEKEKADRGSSWRRDRDSKRESKSPTRRDRDADEKRGDQDAKKDTTVKDTPKKDPPKKQEPADSGSNKPSSSLELKDPFAD